jgi:peptide/nickel transport system permease protein
MKKYIIGRFLKIIPLLFIAISINFALIRLAPGDPIDYLLSDPDAPAGYAEELRKLHGLDKPIHIQYIIYIKKALTGDLGYSFFFNRPVASLVFERLGATLLLTISAFIISLIVGIAFGFFSSKKPYSITDNLLSTSSMVIWSMPSFWVAMVFIIIFSVKLDIFPISGMQTIGAENKISDIIYHLFLPAMALGLSGMAGYFRLTRASMLEELDKDYVTLAWSKGLTENQVYFKHAFRNALLPTVTAVGLRLRFLFTGAALTEIVFAWPGIGRLLNESIFRRDYYMITSIFIMVSSVILLSSLLADIMYAFVDPRIRYGDRP